MAKRILFLFAANIGAVLIITVILAIFGIGATTVLGLAVGCFVFGMAGAGFSLLISKWSAKRLFNLKIIDPDSGVPVEKKLYTMVLNLSEQAGIDMPEVGIYQSDEPNAFATGASKKNSMIAFSSGLVELMKDDEVEAVAAHEVSHIVNDDMVIMTLMIGIANAFVMFLARIVARVIDAAVSDDDNPFGMGIWAYWALVWLLETIFMLIAYIPISAFSRSREYRADKGAGELTSNRTMADALRRLDNIPVEKPKTRSAYSFAKINTKHKILLYATHPPITMRIERLTGVEPAAA